MIPTFQYGKTIYQVEEVTPKPTGDNPAILYYLTGPRGARYGLMPNVYQREMLFAINANDFTKKTPFHGKWFRVIGEELKIV